MRWTSFLIVVVFLALHVAPPPARAELSVAEGKRVALVIGNSGYKLISHLDNPRRDAKLMAATLRKMGFDVIDVIDGDQRTIKRAIRDFGKRLRAAGRDAVGLFFYAGHGVQAGGINYLIPIGAPIETEVDLQIEAVSAAWVLGQMEYARNRLNIVILDSCRNNPLKGKFRTSTRGLARMNAPGGTLVAYSAAPGQVASDGTGQNSPYTAALVKAMAEPGLKIEDVFKMARIQVKAASRGQQTPWEESSLDTNFYFSPATDHVTPRRDPPPRTTTPGPARVPSGTDKEVVFWNSVKDSKDWQDYQAYLDQHPKGAFVALARSRRDRLKAASGQQQAALTPGASRNVAPTTPTPRKKPGRMTAFDQATAGYEARKKGKLDLAIRLYTSAIGSGELLPKNLAITYLNRGNAYYDKRLYNKAVADYTRAIKGRPEYAFAFNNRGNTYRKLRRYDLALTDYAQAIRIKPDYARAYLNRGNLYYNRRQHDRAIAEYSRAIKIKPDYAQAFYSRANAYDDKRLYDKAVADYTRAIAIRPKYTYAYYNRGVVYGHKRQLDKSIADYTKAVSLNPSYARAYYARGIAYRKKGFYDHAIADYTKAIKLQPDDAGAYYNRAIAYTRKRRTDMALADYSRAIRIKPDYAYAYNNRGNLLHKKGKLKRAIADFSSAVRYKPDYAMAYYNRGNSYDDQKQHKRAIADYTSAIKHRPKYADAYGNRGYTYEKMGMRKKAIADFRKAVRLRPKDRVGAAGLKRLGAKL
ncbi:MAG: tetratricopeptide repeat protein [Alphaproteobacteria bacterium]